MTSVERSPRRLPSRTTAAYWILVAACVVVPTAPPSHAETTSRSDHLGDLRHALDLVSLRVTHGLKNVRVTLEHRNLKRMGAEGWFGFVYLDTYGGKRGPEFLFVGPMGSTTWSLYPVGDFYDEYEESLCPNIESRALFGGDQTRVRLARRCLNTPPRRVRVAAYVSNSHVRRYRADWIGERRSFTEWIVSTQTSS